MGFFGGRKKGKGAKDGDGGKLPTGADAAEGTPSPDDGPPTFSEKDIISARKWFKQANKLIEDRNYEYAIECFLTGLKFWPEAVEEAHLPLRGAAYARRDIGGKKPSKIEEMKHPMTGKDPLQALLNAEWRWSRDPTQISYIGGIVKNAARGRYEETLLFIAPIYFDAAKNAKKLSKDPFVLLYKSYDDAGNRCEVRGDLKRAIAFFEGGLTVLEVLNQLGGLNSPYRTELKDLTTKVTIIKGKYGSGEDFRGSIKDSDAQRDIHDRERMVMDGARLEELINDAREGWRANPAVTAKLIHLVDLLCRDETPEREEEAIKLLDDEFASGDNYNYKVRSDDIRTKLLRRRIRQAAAAGDKQALRQAQIEQLKFELRVFKERADKYPTDNKIKFELGKRLVQARSYDQAIPMLQEARNDPKNRTGCMLLIGRCFLEKGLHSQAINSLNQAIGEHELIGDDLGKSLYYWLGRACEAASKPEDAAKAFGQVIQWDYNYKDVRKRLEALEE
ncbi:MAG: tetratricopeptide repeat protein [Planctomycetes bacterium]|nr:tetratricopeptide repeat protein [Planctomycetota bacterium]